jgi:NTE family protein
MSMATRHAVVLGSGGLAGIAWQTGLLHGLAESGIDVSAADLFVGTSAGATVAAQLASGHPVADWYRRLVEPELQNEELLPVGVTMAQLFDELARLLEEYPDPTERRHQVGLFALAADTVPEATRRAVIAGRLLEHTWPARRLAIVAVEAENGDRCVFDADSGVDLVDAVAASSAVPGIWPPVTIGSSHYVDGGMYSSCSADLAAAYESVLILAMRTSAELDAELALLAESSRTVVVLPDADSQASFGANPLDPAIRTPAARAGYAQGAGTAASLTSLWIG